MNSENAQICAIYCRLSREDEDRAEESESIVNQRSLLTKYASERGWQVYDTYCDEDYSGADGDRPAFLRMLKDAEAGRFGIILCKTQSRFTRDMELVEKYIHRAFPAWGIRFVAACDGADTEVRGNKKARQINGLVNEWYLEDLSENIRMVLDHKRSEGQYIGGSALFGYKKDPGNKSRLVIDEEAAIIVRRIYSLSIGGMGAMSIAQTLNDGGIPNPTYYKKGTGTPLWSRGTVQKILKNEMYTGTMVQGRRRKESYKSKRIMDVPEAQWIRVENTHEPIIDRETFDAAQKVRRLRSKTGKKGENYPLAGLIRCMDCGGAMTKTSNGYKGGELVYLRCRRSMLGKNSGCTRHSVRLDLLTELIEERVRARIGEWYEPDEAALRRLFAEKDGRAQKERSSIIKHVGRLDAALAQAYLDFVGGRIGGEAFSKLKERFQSERRGLEARREELTEKLSRDNGLQCAAEEVRASLCSGKIPRRVFFTLIESVEVGERDDYAGTQAIRINWKF